MYFAPSQKTIDDIQGNLEDSFIQTKQVVEIDNQYFYMFHECIVGLQFMKKNLLNIQTLSVKNFCEIKGKEPKPIIKLIDDFAKTQISHKIISIPKGNNRKQI